MLVKLYGQPLSVIRYNGKKLNLPQPIVTLAAAAVGGPGEHRRGWNGGLVAVVGAAPHDDAAVGGPVHQAVRAGGVYGHLVEAAGLVPLCRGRRRLAPAGARAGDRYGAPWGGGVAEQEGNRADLSPRHLHPLQRLPGACACSTKILGQSQWGFIRVSCTLNMLMWRYINEER